MLIALKTGVIAGFSNMNQNPILPWGFHRVEIGVCPGGKYLD